MAARVSDAEVREIMDTEVSDLSAFITAANLTVDRRLKGQGLQDDELKEIERWLAAHLATAKDPRVSKESIGDASSTYQGGSGLGLDSSRYGQMVQSLDPTGRLVVLDKKKATMYFL